MGTPRQSGLRGTSRTSPGENLDSGTPQDGRENVERAREGRSRKAADNALDRTPAEQRRVNPTDEAAPHQATQGCPICHGVRWVCESTRIGRGAHQRISA